MIVVLGGGIAGLAAAGELAAAGAECIVLERETEPGGHCRSLRAGGYTFDRSGHFLHSSDPETAARIRALPGVSWLEVERDARIWLRGIRTAYPFQANLHGHSAEFIRRCLRDFAAERIREAIRGTRPPGDFAAWLRSRFGREMCRAFFTPYNRKMWRVPLSRLGTEWTDWSVPVPRFEELLAGAGGDTRKGMGYNATFRYPSRGGIGALPAALRKGVSGTVRTGAEVTEVDLRRKAVRTADGSRYPFRVAISTIPLPDLAARSVGLSAAGRAAGTALSWVKVLTINLGVRSPGIAPGHWTYVPEPRFPFFRVGVLSNVAPYAAPKGKASLFVERSFPRGARIDVDREIASAIRGLRRMGILTPASTVEEVRPVLLDPAYVHFDAARRSAVPLLRKEFARKGILLAGRYGAWEYSGMERAIAQGIGAAREAADRSG
ncbi:MAG: NAD(P)/FAD-dependent oxidoreductase [Deltaproteobacteria bacterium]